MDILIVDDSKLVRQKIEASLQQHADAESFNIYHAPDGKEALEIIKAHYIDIMFLDWNMPVLSGEDLVDILRKSRSFDHIRIIMATTEGSKESVQKMIRRRVNGYIVKPFDDSSILKAFSAIYSKMVKDELMD